MSIEKSLKWMDGMFMTQTKNMHDLYVSETDLQFSCLLYPISFH